jgi:Divergent InlB B-repeat domain/Bacterial Ig domain
MMQKPLLRTAISLAVITMVAACGGGGDSASGSSSLSLLEAGSQRTEQLKAVQHRLTVNIGAGQGRVFTVVNGVDCEGPSCSAEFDANTVVGVRAVPAPGYVFDRWVESHHTQACGSETACNVTMSAPQTVTARFIAVDPLSRCDAVRSNGTSPVIPTSHPKLLFSDTAFKDCLVRMFSTQAPEAMRFKATVDTVLNGGSLGDDFLPSWPAMVYQATGDVRYAKLAVRLMDDYVKSEEAKIAAGIVPNVQYDKYLYVDKRIATLARVYDWVPHHAGPGDSGTNDQLTPEMKQRWFAYVNQALHNVWKAPVSGGKVQAVWGGRAFPYDVWARDNPHNNYYYHYINALMTVGLATNGENPQGAEWLQMFRDKIQNETHPSFVSGLAGGGSREGTGYGTSLGVLWSMYDTWERSTGERLSAKIPYALNSLAHQIHNFTPTLDHMSNTGDQSRDATASLYDYHRTNVLMLSHMYPESPLAGVGIKLIGESSVPRPSSFRDHVSELMFAPPKNVAKRDASVLSTTYWGEGTGQLMMRSSWNMDATYSNFICGPYTESHAHADQGSFNIFRGNWLAYDRNNKSDSGLAQEMEAHNLFRLKTTTGEDVSMRMNSPGTCRVMALADTPLYTYMSADITPVYAFRYAYYNHFNNHLVKKVQREYLFIKPSTFVVMDRSETTVPTQQIFTLNMPVQPTRSGNNFSMQNGSDRLDVFNVTAGSDMTSVVTSQESSRGMGTNWRLETSRTAAAGHFVHVLGTNGSVTNAETANTDGHAGTRITLADGRVATVRFPTAQLGGQLEIVSANGTVVTTGPLPKTIGEPALYAADAPPPVRPAPPPYDPGTTPPPPPSNPPPTTPPPGSPPPPPPSAPAPDVTLPANLDGANYTVGSTVNVPVTLSSGENVTRVELLRNNVKVTEDATAPYQFDLTDLATGNHKLQARVVLANGTTKTSTAVNVRVETPAPLPTGNTLMLRQGQSGYTAVTDVGVSNQGLQYNPKGIVSNDAKTGAFRIGGNDPYEARTFIRFGGLSALAGRRVVKAEVALTFEWGGSGYVLNGKYLTVPWNMSTTNFGWTKRTDGINWSEPGSGAADWVTGAGFQLSGFSPSGADVRKALLDPAIVQGWIDNPQSNQGFVLTNNSVGAVSWIKSSEATNAAHRPTLQITFE